MKKYLPLLLILVLGLCLRLPGVFWGVKIHAQQHFIGYHTDELDRVKITHEFLTGKIYQEAYYPKGYYFQNALAALIVRPFMPMGDTQLILIGRMLSVIYGVLTIGLVYLITKEISGKHLTAVYSSMFLALAGLHVTQSHYAVVDAGTLLMVYAAMYCSLLFVRRNENIYFVLVLILTAMALAFKLSLYVLVPLLYIMWKKRFHPLFWLGALTGVFIIFMAANGFHYTWNNFILTIQNVQDDNVNAIAKYNKLMNPLIYFVEVIPALGLAGFVVFLIGAVFLFKHKNKILSGDIFFIFILPVLVCGISICSLDSPYPGHILPIVVLFTMVAGYGLEKIQRFISFQRFSFLLTMVICYQILYVVNFQYYYIFDTRAYAEQWAKNNIPKGKTIYFMRHAQVSDLGQYKFVENWQAEYLVMNEGDYFRYKRSIMCPFKKYPNWTEVYHGKSNDFKQIQGILKGDSNFKLVAQFPVRFITPENFLNKKLLGTYTEEIGDTRIYQQSQLSTSLF